MKQTLVCVLCDWLNSISTFKEMSKDSRYARNTERGYKGAPSGEILTFSNKNSYNTFIYLQNNIKTSRERNQPFEF